MPTTHVGDRTATESPSAAPGLGVPPSVVIPNSGEGLTVASIAQFVKNLANFVAWCTYEFKGRHNPLFGTGADGDLTLAGTHTAAAEENRNDVTIGASSTWLTRGHILRVKGTLTFSAGATGILDNGLNAPALTGAGGVTIASRAYGWAGRGGATAPVTGIGNQPLNAGNLFSFGGRGGAGSASAGFAGGLGGVSLQDHIGFGQSIGSVYTVASNASTPMGIAQMDGAADIVYGLGTPHWRQRLVGGLGGGSGASDASNLGGGGGEGGGIVLVFARRVVVTGSTTGFQGASAAYSPFCAQGGFGNFNTGTGGCGGGGGGGVVIVVCGDWSGAALTSACVLGGIEGSQLTSGKTAATNGAGGNFAVLPVA